MLTAPSPRSSVAMMKNSTANVVTFIPPAVPAGPPPMNISASMPSHVSSRISPMSTELNPAVRVCTDWKNPMRMRDAGSYAPNVSGFVHSNATMYTVPPTSSSAVAQSTILVFMLQCSGRRNSLRNCMMTGNPRPPRMIAAHIGRQIHGSVAKPIILSVYSAKPALLNDETEWYSACQAASPGL